MSNLGHTYCWFSAFLLQCTNDGPGTHIWDPIFFKSQLLSNNCYPIVPNLLEYMNVIRYTINISSKTFKVNLAWTAELIITSLIGGAIITNQKNWQNTSIIYCLRCLQYDSFKITCIYVCSRDYSKSISRSTMMANNLDNKSVSSKFFQFWSINHVACNSKHGH